MAKSDEIQARRNLIADILLQRPDSGLTVDALLDELRAHSLMRDFWDGFEARQERSRHKPAANHAQGSPKRKKKPMVKGGLDVSSAIRMVQRDLEILEEQGLAEALIIKDERRVVITANERKGRATRSTVGGSAAHALFWRPGTNLTNEVELEGVAGAAALDAICRDLAWLVPESLMGELLDARDRSKRRVEKMRTSSPLRRWLSALKTQSSSSRFERPMFDDDVRHAVEQAIMQRKQLRLTYDGRTFDASVSRLIVKLPDRPVVEVWDHDVEAPWLGASHEPLCLWLRLETINHAELLSADAHWPVPVEDHALPSTQAAPEKVYEFRASPRQIRAWGGTWLFDQMELIGKDPEGWQICRYTDMGEPAGFRRYLVNLGTAIEVLKPLKLRMEMAQHFAEMAAIYGESQQMPDDVKQRRLDDETLAAWGAVPRIVNPEWVPFTQDDRERLQRSRAWQTASAVVEGLCRLFFAEDPAGVYSPENPHAATEYLIEAEQLFELLPRIQTEAAMAEAIRAIMRDNFASTDGGEVLFEDWSRLASVAWLELTGFRQGSVASAPA